MPAAASRKSPSRTDFPAFDAANDAIELRALLQQIAETLTALEKQQTVTQVQRSRANALESQRLINERLRIGLDEKKERHAAEHRKQVHHDRHAFRMHVFRPIVALFAFMVACAAFGHLQDPELKTLCAGFGAWLAIMAFVSPGRWMRAVGTAFGRARRHVDAARKRLTRSGTTPQ